MVGCSLPMLCATAGMWYALSLFYDSGELGPAYATVAMATAVASVLGGPIAACLLMLNGVAGLRGWQASPCEPYQGIQRCLESAAKPPSDPPVSKATKQHQHRLALRRLAIKEWQPLECLPVALVTYLQSWTCCKTPSMPALSGC